MMDRDSELRSNIIITIKILNNVQYEENTIKLKQIESFSWKVGRGPYWGPSGGAVRDWVQLYQMKKGLK